MIHSLCFGGGTGQHVSPLRLPCRSPDQMNVQVHRAASELTGKTGMAILRAIAGGERDPRKLAELRDGRCRRTADEFARYLTGNWREEYLFILELALYDMLQGEMERYERRLREARAPEHPGPKKGRALRSRGEEAERALLWRVRGRIALFEIVLGNQAGVHIRNLKIWAVDSRVSPLGIRTGLAW